MEGEMGREVAVWWGPDSILSALGFGTRENMEAVRAAIAAKKASGEYPLHLWS